MNGQEHSEDELVPRQDGEPQEEIASPKQRFGTFLLDTLFIWGITFVIELMLGLALILTGHTDQIKKCDFLFSLFFPVFYYCILEASTGRTLGKLIMKTKAVKEDGTRLSIARAFLRTLCRYIPFDIFSFLGGEGSLRGWHDKLSKTKVVSLKRTAKTGMAT